MSRVLLPIYVRKGYHLEVIDILPSAFILAVEVAIVVDVWLHLRRWNVRSG